MSAWYRVHVFTDNVWISLLGICGGALQLCLQVGACIIIASEFAARILPAHTARILAPIRGSGMSGGGGDAATGGGGAPAAPSPKSSAWSVSRLVTPRGDHPKPEAPWGSQALPSPLRPKVTKAMLDRLVVESISGSGQAPSPKKPGAAQAASLAGAEGGWGMQQDKGPLRPGELLSLSGKTSSSADSEAPLLVAKVAPAGPARASTPKGT